MTELLPATIAQARRNSAEVPRQPVDLLISLSGFSPETTILAFELLKPERLMIIGSWSTRESIDVIQDALRVPPSRLDVRYVEPTDPLKIYQVVQEAAQIGDVNRDGRARIIIDMTGGKKVMSASVALAAAQLDLPMCYIDGKFDPELRQSEPGTERLVVVPNPTTLFGDRELDAALVTFRHGAYAAAHERFAKVADTAYEPARARFLRDLTDVYQAWCDLNFDGLRDRVAALRSRLADAAYRPPPPLVRRLHDQLRFLDSLVDLHDDRRDGPPLLLNFYLLGRHYQGLGRHDFAALLYYRTIESSTAQRLAAIGPGFSGREPDYSLFGPDPADLAARYERAASAVHGKDVVGLPVAVGLMDGVVLLHVLNDALTKQLGLTNAKAFGHLRTLVHARNQSVLAHGTGTVTAKLSATLENFALRSLRAFWNIEFAKENVDERISALQFLVEV
ncbi:TIGR02710 family CRISPR-associated CARF protein [Micromonospora matsumotoense]|uniref:TIGR02710 family CRISPR-associated CARF protein n=1 Tax=Micromonospora matsumotoense TaxID=121616 RepID=UPI003D91395B